VENHHLLRTQSGHLFLSSYFTFGIDKSDWNIVENLVSLCSLLTVPALFKISIFLIMETWKLIRKIIYEIFFEATRAMNNAKKSKKE
jgi:ABC-type phosphate transport system permease subunit